MDWQQQYGEDNRPTDAQIEDFIQSPLWRMLNDELRLAYEAEPKVEYSRCSMQAGWNIKYKKRGKSLCTLYPMRGYFIALVVIGSGEMQEAELLIPSCSEYVQHVFTNTQLGQGQKWLMIDVREIRVLRDIQNLIALRVKPPRGITHPPSSCCPHSS